MQDASVMLDAYEVYEIWEVVCDAPRKYFCSISNPVAYLGLSLYVETGEAEPTLHWMRIVQAFDFGIDTKDW